MNWTKEAAPGVGTGNGKAEKVVGTSNSDFYSNMKQGPISSILLHGKENALPGREIRRILGLKDGREVTSLVERERRGGVPICASCDYRHPGYYLPGTPDELEEYIRSLQGRIREVMATRDALEMTLCCWTGQEWMDWGDSVG